MKIFIICWHFLHHIFYLTTNAIDKGGCRSLFVRSVYTDMYLCEMMLCEFVVIHSCPISRMAENSYIFRKNMCSRCIKSTHNIRFVENGCEQNIFSLLMEFQTITKLRYTRFTGISCLILPSHVHCMSCRSLTYSVAFYLHFVFFLQNNNKIQAKKCYKIFKRFFFSFILLHSSSSVSYSSFVLDLWMARTFNHFLRSSFSMQSWILFHIMNVAKIHHIHTFDW